MKGLIRFSTIIVVVALYLTPAFGITKSTDPNTLKHFYIGNNDAPVTIYEFISLSCPYCLNNINILLPSNAKDNALSSLIKNGKAKVIIMDMPVHGKLDLLAHSILYYSNSNEQYLKLVKLFLNNQKKWFKASNPIEVIVNYARLAGFTDKVITHYKQDTHIEGIIIKNANRYMKEYRVKATPTTIIERTNTPINPHSYVEVGIINPNDIAKVINSLIRNE